VAWSTGTHELVEIDTRGGLDISEYLIFGPSILIMLGFKNLNYQQIECSNKLNYSTILHWLSLSGYTGVLLIRLL
jgi:hypothetical protein